MDFPYCGASLIETGHIWGFRALSGEREGANVVQRGHISEALRRILSRFR